MKKFHPKTSAGFTLIELMLATIIFSVILVVILASFLQVGRIYYKGVSVAGTNEAARNVVDDISSDVQLSPHVSSTAVPFTTQPSPNANDSYFCAGGHRYSYSLSSLDHKVGVSDISSPSAANPNGIVRDDVGNGCPDPSVAGSGTNPQQLLQTNMQLNNLQFSCNNPLGGVDATCTINIRIVYYGADDSVLVDPNSGNPAPTASNAVCSGSILSTQFCSVAEFDTSVLTNF